MDFELRDRTTGLLIRAYSSEAPALAFIRDVARLAGREEAARFSLVGAGTSGGTGVVVVEGEALVRRAVEDQVL